MADQVRYENGTPVAVGDLVIAGDRGFGQVKGRDSMTPEGFVVVDFGEVTDEVAGEVLVPVSTGQPWRKPAVFTGGGWDWWRVGALVLAGWLVWGLVIAVVHAWVWVLGGLF